MQAGKTHEGSVGIRRRAKDINGCQTHYRATKNTWITRRADRIQLTAAGASPAMHHNIYPRRRAMGRAASGTPSDSTTFCFLHSDHQLFLIIFYCIPPEFFTAGTAWVTQETLAMIWESQQMLIALCMRRSWWCIHMLRIGRRGSNNRLS
eukprot:4713556-Amphidinium_carterae.1